MKKYGRIAAFVLCLMLIRSPAYAFWPFDRPEAAPTVSKTEENAYLRVRLKSLKSPKALGLTLDGVYAVEGDPGFRFDRGASLKVSVEGDALYLNCGGLTINMGTAFTLTRHAAEAGANNGVIIHETERENLYCGDLALEAKDGVIVPTLTIDVEDYLYGVLPYEMSDSFPAEALKAQAVAARTYALNRRAASEGRGYDVVDTTGDQVFRGLNPKYENAVSAVDQTRGIVGR